MKTIIVDKTAKKIYAFFAEDNEPKEIGELTEIDDSALCVQRVEPTPLPAKVYTIENIKIRLEGYIHEELINHAKDGWHYTPRINPAACKPYNRKPYWHRIRSFCVRKGYR